MLLSERFEDVAKVADCDVYFVFVQRSPEVGSSVVKEQTALMGSRSGTFTTASAVRALL